jgi:hypothetical protein
MVSSILGFFGLLVAQARAQLVHKFLHMRDVSLRQLHLAAQVRDFKLDRKRTYGHGAATEG